MPSIEFFRCNIGHATITLILILSFPHSSFYIFYLTCLLSESTHFLSHHTQIKDTSFGGILA